MDHHGCIVVHVNENVGYHWLIDANLLIFFRLLNMPCTRQQEPAQVLFLFSHSLGDPCQSASHRSFLAHRIKEAHGRIKRQQLRHSISTQVGLLGSLGAQEKQPLVLDDLGSFGKALVRKPTIA